MRNTFLAVMTMTLTACAGDPLSPETTELKRTDSLVSVACSNGQKAPAATLQATGRHIYTVRYCAAKTVTGFDGVVSRSQLQQEQFVFDDPTAVWSMSVAEDISACMTKHNGDPLCYFPFI